MNFEITKLRNSAIAALLLCLPALAQQIDYVNQIKNKPAVSTTAPLAGGGILNPNLALSLTPCAALQLYRTNSTATGWDCVSISAAAGPGAAEHIQYVTLAGNDANDGLTWATAKLTCAAAIAAIGLNNGTVWESPAMGADCIAATGSTTGLNGFIWAPGRFYIGPSAQATAGSNKNSLEFRIAGSLWTGAQAADDFYTLKVFENGSALSAGSDLELNHSSISGGAGRFLINTDTVIGTPGDATAGTNFNSFAGDLQGSYFSGGGSHPALIEYATTITPNSGSPVNVRMNFLPIFPDGAGSNTSEFCLGGTGTLSAVGNYAGAPAHCWTMLPRDAFTATYQHTLTGNRIYTTPDVSGILPTLAGSPGHIQFNSGGTNLGGDANLFWDNTNKRLGLGQAVPLVPLHTKTTVSGGWPQYELENGAAGGANWFFGGTDTGNGAGGGKFLIHHTNSSSGSEFTIDSTTGNVGISNTAPAVELDVTGKVNASVGFRVANAATSGRYLKGDGTNFVQSSGSASGTGVCASNTVVKTLNSDAAPTCSAGLADNGTTVSTGSETLTINGDTAMSAAPRFVWAVTYAATLPVASIINRTQFEKAITAVRLDVILNTGVLSGCTTAPIFSVSDGTNSLSCTINNGSALCNATGSVSLAANTNVDIKVNSFAGCASVANPEIAVQYKMQ